VGILCQPCEAAEEQKGYLASIEEWKRFLMSRCWKDLEFFMSGSVEDAKDLLSLAPNERSIQESDEALRGGLKVLRSVLAFPEDQILELENDRRCDDTNQ